MASSPKRARTDAAPAAGRPKVVLFGDSITQTSFAGGGWGAALSDAYQRRADVVNRGFSGYNTDWFLRYAATEAGDSDLFGHGDVRLATVFFGANDASDPVLNARQHVPLEDYKANLRRIIALVREKFGEGARIVVISPPPVCHEGRLRFQKERYKAAATGELERTLELSGKYAAGAGAVARELGLPFLDLWTGMQEAAPTAGESKGWRAFLSDGLHLSREGNGYVAEALLGLIESAVTDLAVKPCGESGNFNSASACPALGRFAPWHDEIDAADPAKAFGES